MALNILTMGELFAVVIFLRVPVDYEFRCDTFNGSFHAEFSMGHEAMGRWLVDELGTLEQDIEEVLTHLKRVIDHGGEWVRKGTIFQLHVTQEEALIEANVLFEDNDEQMPDIDLHAYEGESMSLCGPEDFLLAIESWQDFLQRYDRRRPKRVF